MVKVVIRFDIFCFFVREILYVFYVIFIVEKLGKSEGILNSFIWWNYVWFIVWYVYVS